MNKTIGIIVCIIIVIVGIVFISKGKNDSQYEPIESTDTVPVATSTPVVLTKSYTLTEVALHPNVTSCWSAINGKVYDLTKWIDPHPGGEKAILGICGKDGSTAFNGQHGGMQKQADVLKTFYIGELAK